MDEHSPVVVIGAAAMDTKGRPRVILRPGSSSEGDVRVSVGGAGRNIAENLARLSVSTSLLTAVGKDGSGQRILSQARASGINTDRILVTGEFHTAAYMNIYDETGRSAYSIYDMSIMELVTPQYLYRNRLAIAEAAMIAIDANLPRGSLRSLFAMTQKYGKKVCADPTTVDLAQHLKPYLSSLYMVTPNAAEAEVLSGIPVTNKSRALRAAKKLVSMGVRVVVVTLGEEGLSYASEDSSGTLPAIRSDVVDLTGAGDALTAAVVFGLLNGMHADDAVRLGLAAAVCRDRLPESQSRCIV
jgi:pseudouridine kinase